MLLAGNVSTPIQNQTVSTTQVQAPISGPSPLPSPVPLASHASSKPVGGSYGNNEIAIVRPVASSATPINHLESPNAITSVGRAAVKMVPQGIACVCLGGTMWLSLINCEAITYFFSVFTVGLPQARKASLARFLEKRKER